MNISGDETELYRNVNNDYSYKYARPYKALVEYELKQIMLDGHKFVNIIVSGVPDGVSPDVNEALVKKETLRRLYIFSNSKLNDNDLETIDTFYGKFPYPIFTAGIPCAIQPNIPNNNFYMCEEQPSTTSRFVEYRYVQKRHEISNIVYNSTNGFIYRFVLPKRPMLVIIMPANFIRTGPKTGYFKFDNNIIIRVYSDYLLSAGIDEINDELISVITTEDTRLMECLKGFFSRMGMHIIMSNSLNQLYAYDSYMTLIVGSVANISLP